MKYVAKEPSVVFAVFIALALGAAPPSAQDDRTAVAGARAGGETNDYTRSVARPYQEALAAVKEAAKAQGFRVSNVHDIAGSLRKDGIEREPYTTVEVCNTKLAAQVLRAEPRLGTLMPCRIAVYQQGNRTVVSMVLALSWFTVNWNSGGLG